MVKKIIPDPIFLAGTSELATKEDLQFAQNLLDTPMVHKDGCVGMAANMIDVKNASSHFLMRADEFLYIR